MVKEKIKVMIVDDSLSIRMLLNGLISSSSDMEVIAMASDPLDALEKLKTHHPDVMTLDVEMPNMDGITFLKKLMKLRPLPVVMISTLTTKGSSTAIDALEHGAVDVVGKPSAVAKELEQQSDEILDKIRAASFARVGQNSKNVTPPTDAAIDLNYTKNILIDEVYPRKEKSPKAGAPLIAVGSSTGGPTVLKSIFKELTNTNMPPIVVVQHMSAQFTAALAASIDKISPLTVQEAKDGMALEKGNIYIAPGGYQLIVKSTSLGTNICQLSEMGRVNRHNPAVDVLFRSAEQASGRNCTAILLTGMGDDGARTLKDLNELGAETMVQSEETCAVFGMPRMALAMHSKHRTLSPEQITQKIKEMYG